ncbi:hypothetical protein EPK99_10290 [Neorhizobium lilium]|uniref:Uncharacterized protein n=1 Tax=Neorhizobium lilium TaxID=2503024 RepID=A0A3S3S7R5_9HYPH|nr:hypothetical protein [Neorhizobium lilium]RWX78955.1 hypothetical protein EPK99_10290 [Neorhizobium lilium]
MAYDPDQNNDKLTRPVAAPKVDEALAAIESRSSDDDAKVSAQEELDALRAEVARMKDSAIEVASASKRLARSGTVALRDDLEVRIKARPLAAVAIAAAVGYVWGLTR